jgi:predicted phosphodiesterase
LIEKEGNVLIMNPGSPSLPRQWDRKRTFGIITIGDEIQTEIIEIKS